MSINHFELVVMVVILSMSIGTIDYMIDGE